MNLQEILTCHEVAKLLRVTPQHVRSLAKKKAVPSMRVGTEYRFVREELFDQFPNLKRLCSGNR